ncbi:MAG: hypothetical protein K0R50_1543 [Eubacterium sp.]|nr:hypothetical protein [Eubacterium sp.]
MRPEYPQSLGSSSGNREDVFKELNKPVPELFRVIYSNVSGTKRNVEEQNLMDFTPGYRLIHITELIKESSNVKNILIDENLYDNEVVIPILGNYSSDYICYYKNNSGEELICSLTNDSGELIVRHNSPGKFFETVCEFYRQEVYFLDSDGLLDYDTDKEYLVGSSINHGCLYWSE